MRTLALKGEETLVQIKGPGMASGPALVPTWLGHWGLQPVPKGGLLALGGAQEGDSTFHSSPSCSHRALGTWSPAGVGTVGTEGAAQLL